MNKIKDHFIDCNKHELSLIKCFLNSFKKFSLFLHQSIYKVNFI